MDHLKGLSAQRTNRNSERLPKDLHEASETNLNSAQKANTPGCTSVQATLSTLLKQSLRSSELTPTVHGTKL